MVPRLELTSTKKTMQYFFAIVKIRVCGLSLYGFFGIGLIICENASKGAAILPAEELKLSAEYLGVVGVWTAVATLDVGRDTSPVDGVVRIERDELRGCKGFAGAVLFADGNVQCNLRLLEIWRIWTSYITRAHVEVSGLAAVRLTDAKRNIQYDNRKTSTSYSLATIG